MCYIKLLYEKKRKKILSHKTLFFNNFCNFKRCFSAHIFFKNTTMKDVISPTILQKKGVKFQKYKKKWKSPVKLHINCVVMCCNLFVSGLNVEQSKIFSLPFLIYFLLNRNNDFYWQGIVSNCWKLLHHIFRSKKSNKKEENFFICIFTGKFFMTSHALSILLHCYKHKFVYF